MFEYEHIKLQVSSLPVGDSPIVLDPVVCPDDLMLQLHLVSIHLSFLGRIGRF